MVKFKKPLTILNWVSTPGISAIIAAPSSFPKASGLFPNCFTNANNTMV